MIQWKGNVCMSRNFQLERDYYDEGFNLYKKKTIKINPGVTVLVGCNGIGKTTLLHQIRHALKEENMLLVQLQCVHLKVKIL